MVPGARRRRWGGMQTTKMKMKMMDRVSGRAAARRARLRAHGGGRGFGRGGGCGGGGGRGAACRWRLTLPSRVEVEVEVEVEVGNRRGLWLHIDAQSWGGGYPVLPRPSPLPAAPVVRTLQSAAHTCATGLARPALEQSSSRQQQPWVVLVLALVLYVDSLQKAVMAHLRLSRPFYRHRCLHLRQGSRPPPPDQHSRPQSC